MGEKSRSMTIREILAKENQQTENAKEYRQAVEESNKKLHEYEQQKARTLVEAQKFTAL